MNIEKIHYLQETLLPFRKKGYKIGLVPTMGALHEGHLHLIQQSMRQNDVTVCSIFVNPTQFNNQDDYHLYPQRVENDLKSLKDIGCDFVFTPSLEEIYPNNQVVNMNFGYLENIMEGKFRPGHFSGVGTIVSKLFHIVQPHNAYFGQKDLQQYVVISRLVQDLNFSILLNCCPIIREEGGLAMSSRNERLSMKGKQTATLIYETLKKSESLLREKKIDEALKLKNEIDSHSAFKVEYFEIVDAQNLLPITKNTSSIAICAAVYLEGVRLIDNLVINY